MQAAITPHAPRRFIASTPGERGASVNGSAEIETAPFALIISNDQKGTIHVKAVNLTETDSYQGQTVTAGQVYYAKQVKGKDGVQLNLIGDCPALRKLSCGSYLDDSKTVEQITAVLLESAAELIAALEGYKPNFGRLKPSEGRTLRYWYEKQLREERAGISIGDHQEKRAEDEERKKDRFWAAIFEKEGKLGLNDRGRLSKRIRIRDRHAYADSLAELTAPDISEIAAATAADRLNHSITWRRAEPRRITPNQVRNFKHTFIPHEHVKSNTRRESSVRTSGRNGSGASSQTNWEKGHAASQRRIEDRLAVAEGRDEIEEAQGVRPELEDASFEFDRSLLDQESDSARKGLFAEAGTSREEMYVRLGVGESNTLAFLSALPMPFPTREHMVRMAVSIDEKAAAVIDEQCPDLGNASPKARLAAIDRLARTSAMMLAVALEVTQEPTATIRMDTLHIREQLATERREFLFMASGVVQGALSRMAA